MRGKRQAILGVAAVALIALLAGCVGRGQAAPFGRNDQASSAAPSNPAAAPGATSPGQRPPTGFVPASASFPTPETGFAWGIYPCPIDPNAFCPGLAVTRDGGETWKLRTPPAGTPIDPYHPAILRFTDIINGWAVLGDQLQVTHDGAATWQPVRLPGASTQNPASQPIVALETGPVSVYVVAGPTTGPLHLYRSGTSGTTFELIGGVSLPAAGATVHLSFGADGSGYLAADSVTGPNPTIFATTNGVTWVPRPSPCATGSRTAIAAGSAGAVGVICDTNANENGASKQLWTSTDAGVTFVPTEGPAETGFTTAMAMVPTVGLPVALPTTGPASGSAIVPTSTYVVAASAGEDRLYLGLNGGRSWTVAYANSGDASGAALGLADLAFTDAVHGMVLLGNAGLFAKDRLSGSFAVRLPRLLITTDGGRHWAQSVIH